MPAVTVDDILALDRVSRPTADSVVRPVMTITSAPSGFEGEGFPVRRGFAGIPHQQLDPFIMLDQMGENEWRAGKAKGTPWHPHRGFETVTYMIEGTFKHRDSEGGGGVISDGDTQWMTAGAGILHIEVPSEEIVISGGTVHGTQLWVNLPRDKKWTNPRYQDISRSNLSLLSSHDGGALIRVIAGSLDGHDGPGVTYSPITYIHATVSPGARLEIPWRPEVQRAGLRVVWQWLSRSRTEAHPVGTGRSFWQRRLDRAVGRRGAGQQIARVGDIAARWSTDPRTHGVVRPVRHEYSG